MKPKGEGVYNENIQQLQMQLLNKWLIRQGLENINLDLAIRRLL